MIKFRKLHDEVAVAAGAEDTELIEGDVSFHAKRLGQYDADLSSASVDGCDYVDNILDQFVRFIDPPLDNTAEILTLQNSIGHPVHLWTPKFTPQRGQPCGRTQ
ncbi:predicted protein [Sclerotinia sclerotiorum 1980 UF-70]|uniref:Uncharacterized protein n=1 Tax=Sclerotinia sclerotiorum (strain ATCC 18683 / 1980 / Ss-1) TaxID=665079 RepID=A7EN62_SCLS1|nr:predicted protein [Sclerotinia sclerotiorum 1980 UF-70]EDO04278.1 predicted protein [Sclerotinia sclerotiorum 1980 UF-70]